MEVDPHHLYFLRRWPLRLWAKQSQCSPFSREKSRVKSRRGHLRRK